MKRRKTTTQPLSPQAKRGRIKGIVSTCIIIAGLLLINYPLISDIATKLQPQYVSQYSIDKTEQKALLKEADAYNTALAHGKDTMIYKHVTEKGFAFGRLEVPAIGVNNLVEYGTEGDVLSKTLGVVEEFSLPVGGKTSHCTISGHTGMASQQMLTGLDEMKEGDLFFLHCLGRDLAYQVDDIKVVLPNEGQYLKLEKGRDIVTLLTCTPYGINDHRLLVTGHRIPYDFSKKASEQGYDTKRRLSNKDRLQFVIAGASAFYIGYRIVKMRKRRKQT